MIAPAIGLSVAYVKFRALRQRHVHRYLRPDPLSCPPRRVELQRSTLYMLRGAERALAPGNQRPRPEVSVRPQAQGSSYFGTILSATRAESRTHPSCATREGTPRAREPESAVRIRRPAMRGARSRAGCRPTHVSLPAWGEDRARFARSRSDGRGLAVWRERSGQHQWDLQRCRVVAASVLRRGPRRIWSSADARARARTRTQVRAVIEPFDDDLGSENCRLEK
ncbi:hypothetical protein BD310DRAFT_368162 [Dichomitus squalens]|uniref:Uncharacterized protein n=1 Tax=Dichomitus squalens TaxID=114155 RepID=A0A4V2K678_9APHY|nr:hypothetical protein BD310DRAFT_368162 [Dichomitus squalens]